MDRLEDFMRNMGAVCAALMLAAAGCRSAQPFTGLGTEGKAMKGMPDLSHERIVNLGDSITDGQTYALLVGQALTEAGLPAPTFIGAGVGGDTSGGMLKRLDRDVLVHRPTRVMLCCGINDLGMNVPLTNYEANVTAIAERLKQEKVGLILLTTSNIRGGAGAEGLRAIETILRGVARKYGLPVAEVYARMEEARKEGKDLWEKDGAHLNFEGYRAMTRAVLDVMGYKDVPVPTEQHCQPMPGIIARWKVLTVPDQEPPLDEKRVVEMKVDERWNDYALPEEKKLDHWWSEQERSRGFAMSLNELFGGKRHYALAEVVSPARKAYVNTGGELGAVWFNGRKLDIVRDCGWHAGGNRVPVEFRQGTNTVLVETGGRFFLSITDTNTW
jgi:lysophospholipase L1-like esterase